MDIRVCIIIDVYDVCIYNICIYIFIHTEHPDDSE